MLSRVLGALVVWAVFAGGVSNAAGSSDAVASSNAVGASSAVNSSNAASPSNAAAPSKAHAFEDTIAERARPCTLCHGAQGRAGPDGYYPRIAGKPAGYLLHQLQNFRDGRRQYEPMAVLLEHLGDDYLREIAGYFATLDLPYPPPQPAAVSGAVLERGRRLVAEGDAARQLPACAACHGSALTGVVPAIPGLLGLPRDYLNGQLGAWKAGQRRAHAPDCMAEIVQKLSPDDIAALTGWLAAQPLPANTHPAAALPAPLPLTCGGVPASAQAVNAAGGAQR
ncbi:MAG: cytochrome C [Lautropia sp. SCN 66-9]|nr:MAG: cytochrome C [Lautropia sp. SCN 66-9]